MISPLTVLQLIGCSLLALAAVMSWAALPDAAPGFFPIFIVGSVLTLAGAFWRAVGRREER